MEGGEEKKTQPKGGQRRGLGTDKGRESYHKVG